MTTYTFLKTSSYKQSLISIQEAVSLIFLQMSILSTPHTIYPTRQLNTPNIKINHSTLRHFPQ